jgi:hypothetical protein
LTELRARAERFLCGPLPAGEQTEGNATLGLIARYAAGGSWNDPLLLRLAAGCASVLEGDLDQHPNPSRRAYYAEAAKILRAILAETAAGSKRQQEA